MEMGNGSGKPLPKPNVVLPEKGTPMEEWTPEAVRGIVVNPVYAGVGPYPQMITDEKWIRAGATMIEDEGAEQFLVNLLFVLRQCFREEDFEPEEE